MNLVFLQNSATQPRCHKRYRSFKQAGVTGVVYSFNRNWYNVNLPKDIPINSLGDLEAGSYFKRLLLFVRVLRPIFKKHKESVFYCYGQDMAFIAFLFNKSYIYEESDIMYLEYNNKLVRWFLKKLDIQIQKKSKATVLTSQGFVDFLYGKNKPKKIFMLPNKLDSSFMSAERPMSHINNIARLKFSFIGLLRYETTITAFVEEMMSFNPIYEFHIWGDGSDKQKSFVNRLCHRYPNQVYYHGPFRNPDDLLEIYSQIDLNFVCYDTNGLNERIAEPNKLYESTFFNTPILVSPNTYLSKVVNRWGTGFVVDCHDRVSIKRFFEDLNIETINSCIQNCKNIPTESLVTNISSVQNILDFVD